MFTVVGGAGVACDYVNVGLMGSTPTAPTGSQFIQSTWTEARSRVVVVANSRFIGDRLLAAGVSICVCLCGRDVKFGIRIGSDWP